MQLRTYQEKLIAGVRGQYRAGSKRVLMVSPTGSGKTVIFSYIAHHAAVKGNRILICAHRVELIDQISDALTLQGTHHGIIAAGREELRDAAVQVASVQTLNRRYRQVRQPQLIVVDEGHHAVADTWATMFDRWPAARVLGVTATPCRTSGRGLAAIYDSMVIGPDTAELTALGYLTPARVFAPPTVDASSLPKRGGDYAIEAAEALTNKRQITGDVIQHYRKHADGRPALAFCISVAHAGAVAQQFRDEGYSAVALNGGSPRDERRRIVGDFKAGRINVMASCDLFSEGFDAPGTHAGILLRPTMSLALYLQQVGRCLRTADGKAHAVILDHVGNTRRFGLPSAAREWSLDEGARKSARARGHKDCPLCFAALESWIAVCPECGHHFAPEAKPRTISTANGDLEEVRDVRALARDRRMEQVAAVTLEELIALGKKRGYKNAGWWARQVIQARNRKAGGTTTNH